MGEQGEAFLEIKEELRKVSDTIDKNSFPPVNECVDLLCVRLGAQAVRSTAELLEWLSQQKRSPNPKQVHTVTALESVCMGEESCQEQYPFRTYVTSLARKGSSVLAKCTCE